MKSLLHSIPAAAAGNMTGMTYRSNWGCSFLFCFQSDLGSSCISSNSSTKLEVNLLKFDISRYHRDWHVLARHWHLIDNRFWSYLHHFAWLTSQEYKLRCALAKDLNTKVFYICLTPSLMIDDALQLRSALQRREKCFQEDLSTTQQVSQWIFTRIYCIYGGCIQQLGGGQHYFYTCLCHHFNFVTNINRIDSESLLMTTTWTLVDYLTEMKAPRM